MRQIIFGYLIGLFWSTVVTCKQLYLIIKHGAKYFYSPEWRTYPEFLSDKKFGTHHTALLKSTAGDISLHYVESGDSSKPLMLFLHGFPEFWYSWKQQIIEFKTTHRVVCVDMRGYGLSDKPQDVASYKIDNLVNDVKNLIHYLRRGSCILVGHDWGGAVAWSFYKCHPGMVDKLVILNCPDPTAFKRVMYSSFRQLLLSWYMFFFQLPYYPEWMLSRMDFNFISDAFCGPQMGCRRLKPTEEELDAYKAVFSAPGTLTAMVNYYRASFRYPPSRTGAHRMKLGSRDEWQPADGEERGKILIIWGEADGALSKATVLASAKLHPGARVVLLPGISHWVQQDAPDQVNSAIRKFLLDVEDAEVD